MKNKNLHFLFGVLMASLTAVSQTGQNPANMCGTGAPAQQWEAWMQEKITEYKAEQSSKRIVQTVIPVIVHVIHFGEAYGVFPNVDSNQIKSQIVVLNNDFAGNGLNSSNVPAVFAGLKSNTGISFCLAARDPLDNAIPEKGVHRVSAAALSWLSPATPTLDLKNYFNTVIIPGTIWDPTKYLNIWISDKPANYPMNGFATYPSQSGLSGLFGTSFSSSNNDGIWVYTKAFGTIGVTPPYDKGRTATHELGHWLGLRHMWGDGNCLSDYVNDTPWQKQAHYGCVTSTPPDQCGVNSAPNGEMPMNFMDMSDDPCRYMFTNEQNIRMQVALSQSPYRNALGTHGKCYTPTGIATASAVAKFDLNPQQCLNSPFYPFNTSSGYPAPTYLWNSTPAANFAPNTSAANPAITLSNPGTYTITMAATNSLSSSSYSMIVTAYGNCATLSPCIDTLRAIKDVDTLRAYRMNEIPNPGSCNGGYLVGTNCYKDKEFAQFYAPITYSGTPYPQVNSVIVLFDSLGTRSANAGVQVTCKLYGGNVQQGPVSLMGQKNDSIGHIVSEPKIYSIGYVGKPNFAPLSGTKIIPHKFDFASPVVINSTSGFFAAVQSPTNSILDSINIFSNTRYNSAIDSSAWYLQFTNSWKTYRSGRGMKIQLAIMPQITCSQAVGLKDAEKMLENNISIMPNPGTGLFNLIFTLNSRQDLDVRVLNATGQEIVHSKIENVMNNVMSLDMTQYPDGIYFAEITGSDDRVIKKIVLTR